MSNISEECRRKIQSHVRNGKPVFVAHKAIMAKNFLMYAIHTKSGNAELCWLCKERLAYVLGFRSEIKRELSKQKYIGEDYVTIGLVPAEIEPYRQSLVVADLGEESYPQLAQHAAQTEYYERVAQREHYARVAQRASYARIAQKISRDRVGTYIRIAKNNGHERRVVSRQIPRYPVAAIGRKKEAFLDFGALFRQ